MTHYELRGTFYLGDNLDQAAMTRRCDQLMEHLLDLEGRLGTVQDPAIGLDMAARTVEVELVITASSFIEAQSLASAAVKPILNDDGQAQERSMALVPA